MRIIDPFDDDERRKYCDVCDTILGYTSRDINVRSSVSTSIDGVKRNMITKSITCPVCGADLVVSVEPI